MKSIHICLLVWILLFLPIYPARKSDWDSPSTDSFCEGEGSDRLPLDLRDEEGGSKPFGGPQQSSDGSIDMWGGNFGLAVRETGMSQHIIKFNSTEPSILKGSTTRIRVQKPSVVEGEIILNRLEVCFLLIALIIELRMCCSETQHANTMAGT
jgi:hypothetical protein